MKKTIALLLCAVLGFTLTACGMKKDPKPETQASATGKVYFLNFNIS